MSFTTLSDNSFDNMSYRQDDGWWNSLFSKEYASPEVRDSCEKEKKTAVRRFSEQDWVLVQHLFEHDQVAEFEVFGANKGGLLVQREKIQGFVPISHLIEYPCDLPNEQRMNFLSEYIGKVLSLKVIECEYSQDRVVFSERAAQSGCGTRKKIFDILKPGTIVQGTITNITRFGIFVDIGGIEGLVHISEISWGRVQFPLTHLHVGDITDAIVLQICEDSCRVALSIKQLHPNPWNELAEKFQSGDLIAATITSLTNFGVFARLENGIEGLIHHSNLDTPDTVHLLKPGENVEVKILQIDPERRRLSLGLVSAT